MNQQISNFKRHYSNGLIIADDVPIEKKAQLLSSAEPGHIVSISWEYSEKDFHLDFDIKNKKTTISAAILPDASGFVIIEKTKLPNNCIIIDATGNQKIRLSVPWQLTRNRNPQSNVSPTCFLEIGTPCNNPTNGKLGQFGINAWVEYEGLYYFELDFHTGRFLWGKEIYD